jgi:hypothetical protein
MTSKTSMTCKTFKASRTAIAGKARKACKTSKTSKMSTSNQSMHYTYTLRSTTTRLYNLKIKKDKMFIIHFIALMT